MTEINIYGTLNNATPDGVIAKAEQIKDSTQGKKQSEINADYKKRIETLEDSGGTGSGTTDYNDLTNKPQINGHELSGNKSASDLGLQAAGNYALKSDIPETDNFATKDELSNITPTIGENGNWFINGEDTGKPAKGSDGADGVSLGEIALVQETGTESGSENKVMSQKAVSEKLTELSSNIGISYSKKIYYKNKANYYINNNGNFVDGGYCFSTDYIDASGIKAISIHNLKVESVNALAVAFYDSEKTFISGISYSIKRQVLSPLFVVIPDNCKYFASSRQSQDSIDLIEIYSYIDYDEIASEIKQKADAGSIFGGQRVEADGSSSMFEFKNTFKEGDVIHLVDVVASSNTYWGLKGYADGKWTVISSRMFNGISFSTKDVVIPSNIDKYEKIAISTENVNILSGHAYYIVDLSIQDFKDFKDFKEKSLYIDSLKESPILDEDVLNSSDNLLNPTKVEKLSDGWWVSDYIKVNEGEIYYLNYTLGSSNGCLTFDSNKSNVTSSLPFVSGEGIKSGISYVRVKIVTSGQASDKDSAIVRAVKFCFSKNNEYTEYSKTFNQNLISPIDEEARNLLSNLMPHQGDNLFCVGDSYTMQGQYFSVLLAVTGLNKVGDTGGDGNGQPFTRFPANIIKNKDLIMKCKFVTILGGTNDYGHGGEKLGTINDCIKDEYAELKVPILKLNEEGYYVKDDSVDITYKVLTEEEINDGQTPKSVYAAIMTCVNIIHSWNKSITVVLCSQPERLHYESQVNCNPPSLRNGMNMDLLAKAMREIHEMFGVPYYDFHANAWTIDQVEVFMNDGTLHPNALGGEKLGRGLGMYINSL